MMICSRTRFSKFPSALLLIVGLVLGGASASAQQLKIATLAPDGSSWMNGLRAAADAVEQRTDGAVTTRFYPGGVMGDASTLLRRIKLGQLHGGTFTVGELATIAPESNLYSLLFQFENAAELAALREEFDPFILEALERGGMIAPAISNGGFAYLFSRKRIEGADQVDTSFKVWIPDNDPLSRRTLERLGASAISLGLAEVYTGLQTGTINTFGSTLSGAIILQWHTRARYVLDLPVLVTAGTLAVDRKAFERISPAHQAIWREEFGRALRDQEAASMSENNDARAALAGEGIEFVQPAAEDVAAWHRVANQALDEMLESGEFELPGIDRLRQRLEEIRGRAP
ncbi:MAG: C4-dicarboxylate ABC transporter [Gammaproteobacteria bacterium HGW-Gammaproteobacteria-8]|nr:MAG: C4-dicarboxylate ABC transporter [Gammaproteobacteria bacterium HGW-Gammaproteobacteria-8]